MPDPPEDLSFFSLGSFSFLSFFSFFSFLSLSPPVARVFETPSDGQSRSVFARAQTQTQTQTRARRIRAAVSRTDAMRSARVTARCAKTTTRRIDRRDRDRASSFRLKKVHHASGTRAMRDDDDVPCALRAARSSGVSSLSFFAIVRADEDARRVGEWRSQVPLQGFKDASATRTRGRGAFATSASMSSAQCAMLAHVCGFEITKNQFAAMVRAVIASWRRVCIIFNPSRCSPWTRLGCRIGVKVSRRCRLDIRRGARSTMRVIGLESWAFLPP